MIVDCHTHIWDGSTEFGLDHPFGASCGARAPGRQGLRRPDPELGFDELLAGEPVDRRFVLGFKSRYLGVEIPTAALVGFVARQPDKLIGFAGVDPTNLAEALDELQRARTEPGIKGITVSPAAQDFHPADSRAMQVLADAARYRIPVLVNPGIHFTGNSKMDFARPVLLDEVARELPDLRMVVAHMGYPWIDECIVLLGRHAHVYADISALLHRPWQAYNALLSAFQYGVMDKLLFGSDFPYHSASATIEALYRINQLVTGTNLPTVPRQALVAIVERDALGLLGIGDSPAVGPTNGPGLLDTHEP